MALTTAQKATIAGLYYGHSKSQGLSDFDIAKQLMTILLNNPSAAQVTLIRTFVQARRTESQALEDDEPTQSTARIAGYNSDQAVLDAIIAELS